VEPSITLVLENRAAIAGPGRGDDRHVISISVRPLTPEPLVNIVGEGEILLHNRHDVEAMAREADLPGVDCGEVCILEQSLNRRSGDDVELQLRKLSDLDIRASR